MKVSDKGLLLENDLLKGLAAGNAEAFKQAYDTYGPALFRTAVRILGSRPDAEDAVQEVFAAMVRGRDRLTQVTNLKAYMFVSLRHVAGRILRREHLQAMTGLDETKLTANAPAEDTTTERLWQVAARLPVQQREVLALKIHGELTFKEIAIACNISPNTAASRYRYALEKLKQMMESEKC